MSIMVATLGLTRTDLDALPDDGLRHELIDGAVFMTPAPGFRHQRVVLALASSLRERVRGTDLAVVTAPFDVVLGDSVLEPDIVVAPRAAYSERDLPVAPHLVVEVRSPSTRWIDEGRKRDIYQNAGVTSYWLMDPVVPSISVLQLTEGSYREVTFAVGDQTIEVELPVKIELNPAVLLRG